MNSLLGDKGRPDTTYLTAADIHRFLFKKMDDIIADTAGAPAPAFTLSPSFEENTANRAIELVRIPPIPTLVVKYCGNDRAPIITKLFNIRVTTRDVTTVFKESLGYTASKKDNLNRSEPSNYRPVSNVWFI